MSQFIEKEITEPVNLCTPDGKLNKESIGWARRPIITSNLSKNFMRKKKWNYWCVFGEKALFSATISHIDYAAVCFIYFLEYETKDFYEKTFIIPFGNKCHMPEGVQETVQIMHKDTGMFFISNENETMLKISSLNFGGRQLEADIHISYPLDLDTLNVVVPWNKKEFQFTAKHHCLPAKGSFTVGDKTFTFNPKTDYAVLDYGRGVWPRESRWNWGMASGNQNNDIIGLNIGGQWTDQTGSTENAVFKNGAITKISEDLQFIYDRENYMKPWEIKSASGDLSLTFKPFFERIAASNVLIVQSEVHQMVGHYYGKIKLDDGETLEIDGLLGCIEDHHAKW